MADEFKPVVLVHPDGKREHTATTAVEYNNLVYGAGYSPKKTATPKKDEGK